jgi:multidrug efflux system membrane fusion protein
MYVDVEIDLDLRPGTVMIPAVAIQSGQKGPFVFVANNDQTADMRIIEVAGIEGDRAALVSGVTQGERVIVEGQMRLTSGMRAVEAAPDGSKPTGSTQRDMKGASDGGAAR